MAKEQGKEKDVYAEFYRMPVNWRELKEDPFPGDRWKVQVERVVELPGGSGRFFLCPVCRLYPGQ